MARRPAVSTITTSRPRRRASGPVRYGRRDRIGRSEKTSTPILRPSTRSCSTAAGRCRSAPIRYGWRPCWRTSAPAWPRPSSFRSLGGRRAARQWGLGRVADLSASPPSDRELLMTSLDDRGGSEGAWPARPPCTRRRRFEQVPDDGRRLERHLRSRATRISRRTSATSASAMSSPRRARRP